MDIRIDRTDFEVAASYGSAAVLRANKHAVRDRYFRIKGSKMSSGQNTDEFDVEAAVAQFLVDFRWDDIQPAAVPAIKSLLKDQLALQLGAVHLPWSKEARSFLNKP